MTEINDWGLTPAIRLNGALACPNCGKVWLHHGPMTVYERFKGEDGDGFKTTIGGQVKTEFTPAARIPNRRNSLEIAFWCETCPEGQNDRTLLVTQHKGQTFVYWEA